MEQKPQIEIRGLCKDYPIPGGEVHALSNISLTIDKGDIYGIIGMSGAGKSTLIRCLNRLDTPTDGQIFIDGENILAMSKQQLRQTRRRMSDDLPAVQPADAKVRGAKRALPAGDRRGAQEAGQRARDRAAKDRRAGGQGQRLSGPAQPAVRSSVSPSPAPWPAIRKCSFATKRPAPWTP